LGDEDWEGPPTRPPTRPPTIGTISNSKVDARAALRKDCDEDIAKHVERLKVVVDSESDVSTEQYESDDN